MGFISKNQVKLFNTAVSKTGMTELKERLCSRAWALPLPNT